MVRLSIHKSSEFGNNVKATVQSTGKLGFSEGAAKKMQLTGGEYFVLASNTEDSEDENLYGWIEQTGENEGFRVNKAGDYFNINTRSLFDKLGINYRDKTNVVIFDIVDFDYGGKNIFKLIKRVRKRNTKKKAGRIKLKSGGVIAHPPF